MFVQKAVTSRTAHPPPPPPHDHPRFVPSTTLWAVVPSPGRPLCVATPQPPVLFPRLFTARPPGTSATFTGLLPLPFAPPFWCNGVCSCHQLPRRVALAGRLPWRFSLWSSVRCRGWPSDDAHDLFGWRIPPGGTGDGCDRRGGPRCRGSSAGWPGPRPLGTRVRRPLCGGAFAISLPRGPIASLFSAFSARVYLI